MSARLPNGRREIARCSSQRRGETAARGRLVVVFARSPSDEARAKPLGRRDRGRVARVHEALLARTLATAAAVPGAQVRLVTTGSLDAMHALAARAVSPSRLEVRGQVGEGFAARLERAVADAFADGRRQVVVVGADAPGLTPALLEAAFARVEAAAGDGPRAILGPATDGGYFLLGLSRSAPGLLARTAIGTAETGRDTERALAAAGFHVDRLPPLDDVDDARDLLRACSRLAAAVDRASQTLRTRLLSLLAADGADVLPRRSPSRRPLARRACPRGPPSRRAA